MKSENTWYLDVVVNRSVVARVGPYATRYEAASLLEGERPALVLPEGAEAIFWQSYETPGWTQARP
jgi:hypothetical protein